LKPNIRNQPTGDLSVTLDQLDFAFVAELIRVRRLVADHLQP